MGFDIFEIIRSVYVEYLWKWNCWKLLFWIYWECWFFFNCDNYFLGCIWVHHIHYEERELNISLRKFSSTQQIILSFWNDSTKSKLNEQWWHITYVSRRRLVAELHMPEETHEHICIKCLLVWALWMGTVPGKCDGNFTGFMAVHTIMMLQETYWASWM